MRFQHLWGDVHRKVKTPHSYVREIGASAYDVASGLPPPPSARLMRDKFSGSNLFWDL